jgi:peptidoglycan/xylan/chitin deacetylase (PgdA/CDA1 family)
MNYLLLKPQNSNEKKVYLTFDDGPNDVATTKVLDVLKKYNIKATFFVIGKNVEREPELARRIVNEGHLIENHSYGNGYLLAFQSLEKIKEDLKKTNRIISETTGQHPKYFRPPNGLITQSLQKACADLNLTPVGIHIYVNDSFINNAGSIARKVLSKTRGDDYIVVLHDSFGTSQKPSRAVIADALEIIIPELNKQGYRWGVIEEKFKQ